VRSSLAPPMRKLWPLTVGRFVEFKMEEQKSRNNGLVGNEWPVGEEKEKRGADAGILGFIEKWEVSALMGQR
jgi:hypothetical protein